MQRKFYYPHFIGEETEAEQSFIDNKFQNWDWNPGVQSLGSLPFSVQPLRMAVIRPSTQSQCNPLLWPCNFSEGRSSPCFLVFWTRTCLLTEHETLWVGVTTVGNAALCQLEVLKSCHELGIKVTACSEVFYFVEHPVFLKHPHWLLFYII